MSARTSGTQFIDEEGNPFRGRGIADTTALCHRLNGESYYNKAFGENPSSDEVSWPPYDSQEFTYWYSLMASMDRKRRDGERWCYRVGGHDSWGLHSILNAYNNNPSWFYTVIDAMVDAAACFGIECVITLGGFSDMSTFHNDLDLFNRNTALYWNHVAMASDLADHLRDRRGVMGIELLNEPDFYGVTRDYWIPVHGTNRLNAYASWQRTMVQDVKAAQSYPGCLISMGVAADSDLWGWHWEDLNLCNSEFNQVWDGLDFANCHLYWTNSGDSYWINNKFPALVNAARAGNRPLFIGECGNLWACGGCYESWIDDDFWNAGNIVSYTFMKRWWDAYNDRVLGLSIPQQCSCQGTCCECSGSEQHFVTCPLGDQHVDQQCDGCHWQPVGYTCYECSPGATQTYTCPLGDVHTSRQCGSDGRWHDVAYVCNECNLGDVQYFTCPLGDQHVSRQCTSDNKWQDVSYTCDTLTGCNPGETRSTTCPLGDVHISQQCLDDRQWHDVAYTCNACSEGAQHTITCLDGSSIVDAACVGGQWASTGNVCPTLPPALANPIVPMIAIPLAMTVGYLAITPDGRRLVGRFFGKH